MKVVGVSAAAKRRSAQSVVADSWQEQCQNSPESSAEPDREQTLSPFNIGVFGLVRGDYHRLFSASQAGRREFESPRPLY